MTRLLFLLTVLVLLPSADLNAQWKAPSPDSLRQTLTDRIAREVSTGLVLGVLDAAGPHVIAAGRRDGPGSPPIDARTVFEIGSISKVFTTTLLAEMAGRGEVALTDPIARYLPAGVKAPSRNGKEITLLDLATASSGLPRLPPLQPADPANPYADFTVDKLWSFLSGYTLLRDPGELYEYSNLGMGLLGQLLAQRAGKPYEELVLERVLKPLGMNDTRIALTADQRTRLARGHDAALEPVANWDITGLAGAGAWRSTAGDMLKFLAAYVNPPRGPLGAALTTAMTSRRPAGSANVTIGLGWHITRRGERRMVWHNGGTGGYHAFLGFDPVSKANALVLSSSAADIDDIGAHVVNPEVPLRDIPAPRPVVAVGEGVLQRYVGRYELAPSFAIEVSREGTSLFAQATGQPRFRLYAATPTRFFLKVVVADIGFSLDPSGAVTGLTLYQNGRETPGRRLP